MPWARPRMPVKLTGVVRPAAHDPLPQGGRPPQRWEINPALGSA